MSRTYVSDHQLPNGYTLIRYGFFCWGWLLYSEEETFVSGCTCLTKAGAIKYATRHHAILRDWEPKVIR